MFIGAMCFVFLFIKGTLILISAAVRFYQADKAHVEKVLAEKEREKNGEEEYIWYEAPDNELDLAIEKCVALDFTLHYSDESSQWIALGKKTGLHYMELYRQSSTFRQLCKEERERLNREHSLKGGHYL